MAATVTLDEWISYREHPSLAERNRIAVAYEDFTAAAARKAAMGRFGPYVADLDLAYQAGIEALFDAIRRYDPLHPSRSSFTTFLSWRIRSKVIDSHYLQQEYHHITCGDGGAKKRTRRRVVYFFTDRELCNTVHPTMETKLSEPSPQLAEVDDDDYFDMYTKGLAPRHRHMALLRVDGYTYREIGKRFQRTDGAIRKTFITIIMPYLAQRMGLPPSYATRNGKSAAHRKP